MPEKNPKKETVKINLPPKPDRAPTIKIPVYKAKNSEAGFDKKSKKFSYVVMNTEGKEERGEIIAPDQNTAIERLKQMGYFPTKVVEATTKKKLAEKDSFAPDKRKERILDLKEKIADTRRKLKENQAGRQEDNHLIEGLREKLSKIKTVSPPTEIEEEKEAEHADLSGPQKMLDLLKKEEKKLELELEKTSKIRFLKRRRLEIDLGNLKFQIDELESKEKRKEGETMEKLSGDSEGTETEAGRQIREQIEEMRRDTERMEKEREDREKAEAEKQRQSAEALRIDKEKNPFKWFMLDQMSAQAFRCLFFKNRESATLEDINTLFKELGSEVQFWSPKYILPARNNTVYMSTNGFTLQLQNVDEVRGETGIMTHDQKAKYKLMDPNWQYSENETALSYEEGIRLLEERARKYQEQQLSQFEGNKS